MGGRGVKRWSASVGEMQRKKKQRKVAAKSFWDDI